MNKPISVQQTKKNMDNLEEQDDNLEEECDIDSILNELSFSNQESNYYNSIENFISDETYCKNEKCSEVRKEIEKLTEDCNDLEKKIILMDKAKTEEFFEISTKLGKVCKNISELQPQIEAYQGLNLSNLTFKQLAKIEFNLLRLLQKVKAKESKIEFSIMNGNIPKPKDNTTLCNLCEEKNIDCLIHPCSHVVICTDCVKETAKCPRCYKFIEYYDKIYLPIS